MDLFPIVMAVLALGLFVLIGRNLLRLDARDRDARRLESDQGDSAGEP